MGASNLLLQQCDLHFGFQIPSVRGFYTFSESIFLQQAATLYSLLAA
jgi:hypothetical protein